jgi:hypothetical protein
MHQLHSGLHPREAAANPASILLRLEDWRRNQHVIDDWRRDLRIKIAWALAAKLLGLILLWLLFFRGNGP